MDLLTFSSQEATEEASRPQQPGEQVELETLSFDQSIDEDIVKSSSCDVRSWKGSNWMMETRERILLY